MLRLAARCFGINSWRQYEIVSGRRTTSVEKMYENTDRFTLCKMIRSNVEIEKRMMIKFVWSLKHTHTRLGMRAGVPRPSNYHGLSKQLIIDTDCVTAAVTGEPHPVTCAFHLFICVFSNLDSGHRQQWRLRDTGRRRPVWLFYELRCQWWSSFLGLLDLKRSLQSLQCGAIITHSLACVATFYHLHSTCQRGKSTDVSHVARERERENKLGALITRNCKCTIITTRLSCFLHVTKFEGESISDTKSLVD